MKCQGQESCRAEASAVTAVEKSVYNKRTRLAAERRKRIARVLKGSPLGFEKEQAVQIVVNSSRNAMTFDAQEMFANLAEKEKLKGHHSPEGRTIRILSRALNGWSMRNLSARDALVLCDQAMEDWLKSRLKVSTWAMPGRPELLAAAVKRELITRVEGMRLQRIHNARRRFDVDEGGNVSTGVVESALQVCIGIVERHW
jgi:hypothetical protein